MTEQKADSGLPTIYTGRYYSTPITRQVLDGKLLPVRITAGYPRGIAYRLPESLPGLTPERAMLDLEAESFRAVFLFKLERLWADTLPQLQAIAERHPGLPLVLLCFENLEHKGQWCHRTMAAEFITEKTGMQILEMEEG